ncbi:MAG: hypothetical protein ACJAXK_000316 [Yoonia sp.]|jgi:uncharacterized protein YjiS (DUF1127 family)
MSDLSLNTCTPRPRTNLWARLSTWRALGRQRRDLAKLDTQQLCDVGISAKQAAAEADRPVWDVPAHWTR